MSTLAWSVVTTVQGRVPLASEGLSLVSSTYNGEDFLVSFGGYNGRYSNEVIVLKPSHKSDMQSKIERPVSESIVTMHPTPNTSRDVGPESEAAQDGKIREIVMDNVDSELLNVRSEETSERVVTTLKAEKEELETTLNREQLQGLQLKKELVEAEARNTELTRELQSVRGQLAAESRGVANLRLILLSQDKKLYGDAGERS